MLGFPPSLRDDLLYLVLFGPGFGESLLVRIPPDDWVVIDGLIWSDSETPARALLNTQKGSCKGVVLTHPHEDHAPGLNEVISPGGLEFVAAVGAYVTSPNAWIHSPDAEKQLKRGGVEHTLAAIDEAWRKAPQSQWNLVAGTSRTLGGATFLALHPDTTTAALIDPSTRAGANRWSSPLLVSWEGVRFLLGADAEADAWQLIASAGHAPPVGVHQLYKVAHHASLGAVHPCQLEPGNPARRWVITPYNRGRKLPRFEGGQGIDQLLKAVEELQLTSFPFAVPPALRGKTQVTRGEVAAAYPPPADPFTPTPEPARSRERAAWLAIGFAADGSVQDTALGPAAVRVRE